MFTLTAIDELHARLGRAESLVDYLHGLAGIGVVRFESFVADGHSVYYAVDGRSVASPAHHETVTISDTGDRERCRDELRRHGLGETSYLEMSAGLAAAGVAGWVADTAALTMSYCDRAGTALVVERLG